MTKQQRRAARQRGVVIATGTDSIGYLSRCITAFDKWFRPALARPSAHDIGTWRSGCARSVCGLGLSLLHYEADDSLFAFIRDDEQGFASFKREETRRSPSRLLTNAEADPLLFELLDNARPLERLLYHFYCSFSHVSDAGFVGRLCRELADRDIRVVQHDAKMIRAQRSEKEALLDHAMRCYVPCTELGYEKFKATFHDALGKSSKRGNPADVRIDEEPDPSRGVQDGVLPRECLCDGQSLAYLRFAGDLRHVQTPMTSTHRVSVARQYQANLEDALARSLRVTSLLAEAMDVAEMMRHTIAGETFDESRPLVRSSMSSIGGWAFVVVCVPVADSTDAGDFGRILKRRLLSKRIVESETRILSCDGLASVEVPWASAHPRRCLTRLEHVDRSGYLADYFSRIGTLADRVSVIQYDSFAKARAVSKHGDVPRAAHRLCISSTEPSLSDVARERLLKDWVTIHEAWLKDNPMPRLPPWSGAEAYES